MSVKKVPNAFGVRDGTREILEIDQQAKTLRHNSGPVYKIEQSTKKVRYSEKLKFSDGISVHYEVKRIGGWRNATHEDLRATAYAVQAGSYWDVCYTCEKSI